MDDGSATFHASPHVFIDDADRRIRLEAAEPGFDSAFDELLAMYLDFDGSQRAMGIPPVGEADIAEWLRSIESGQNLLAWHDERVVGHAVLLPDRTGDRELAIFVHQAYQDAGIGTELCHTLLGDALKHGAGRIWLTVACGNNAAKRLFRSVGFDIVERSHRQLTMDMEL